MILDFKEESPFQMKICWTTAVMLVIYIAWIRIQCLAPFYSAKKTNIKKGSQIKLGGLLEKVSSNYTNNKDKVTFKYGKNFPEVKVNLWQIQSF